MRKAQWTPQKERVIRAAMRRFERGVVEFGSLKNFMEAARMQRGDIFYLVKACAALSKKRKGEGK